VLALLAEADTNAQTIQGWFTTAIGMDAAPGPFVTLVDGLEVDADGFFDTLTVQAHDAITQIETAVEDATFGSAGLPPPPTTDTGSNDADLILKDVGEFAKFLSHCSGSWCWTRSEPPAERRPGAERGVRLRSGGRRPGRRLRRRARHRRPDRLLDGGVREADVHDQGVVQPDDHDAVVRSGRRDGRRLRRPVEGGHRQAAGDDETGPAVDARHPELPVQILPRSAAS
jgi:hypothetical protein